MNFDIFSQFGNVFDTYKKMTDDAVARTQAFYAELEKAEARRVERAESAVEEMTKLQKETMAYSLQLGAEIRKASLETVQRVASTMKNPTSAV